MLRAARTTLILSILLSYTFGSGIKDGMKFGSFSKGEGQKITLSFKRGTTFMQAVKVGTSTFKTQPQISVWVEDTAGKYLQTVYVTSCFGKQMWRTIKADPESTIRTMTMPYWFNRFTAAGNAAPTPSKPLPDAVTGATPTGNFTINFTLPKTITDAVLFAEWNTSFDNNETFPLDSTAFNGQPSVIMSTRINLSDASRTVDTLKIVGHGGADGNDKSIYPDVDKLTTALSIFSKVTATRKP